MSSPPVTYRRGPCRLGGQGGLLRGARRVDAEIGNVPQRRVARGRRKNSPLPPRPQLCSGTALVRSDIEVAFSGFHRSRQCFPANVVLLCSAPFIRALRHRYIVRCVFCKLLDLVGLN